ncbi:aminoglycoside phosphotransferase family protein [Clostridium saccharobutylicum]|uniref:Homoserine kinase n=1 Tax=Clostridium saccharobutylicum TaxID=169679 RepID=A0A1S8NJX6_CLOSA|nr:aminoglycoside phosphotransferase family protein [Clostridium saccharobutylicum]OOM16766.1 homoserine kinase [Clostridium saccharobutylicum]
MEHNWERTLPFLKLDNIKINKLFKGILEEKDIINIVPVEEGCRTTNYIIKTKNAKYILKVFFNKEQDYKKDIKLLNILKDEIPVQRIYRVDTDLEIGNREYAIYEYIEGKTIGQYLREGYFMDEKFVKEVARILAKIHSYKFNKVGFLDADLHIKEELEPLNLWYERVIGERVRKRLGNDIVNKIKQVVKQNEKNLLDLDKDSRLVHGDFQGTNILINKGIVCGILDWEFAMAGHPLEDIGQFFRYEEYFNDDLVRAFEEEYTKMSDYTLSDNWYNISKLRDLVNLIQLIGEKDEMPTKYANIRTIIEKNLSRF